jgi:hypothetical protein
MLILIAILAGLIWLAILVPNFFPRMVLGLVAVVVPLLGARDHGSGVSRRLTRSNMTGLTAAAAPITP